MELRRPWSPRLVAVVTAALAVLLVLAVVPPGGSPAPTSPVAPVDPLLAGARGVVRVIVQQQAAGDPAPARAG